MGKSRKIGSVSNRQIVNALEYRGFHPVATPDRIIALVYELLRAEAGSPVNRKAVYELGFGEFAFLAATRIRRIRVMWKEKYERETGLTLLEGVGYER